VFSTSLGHFPSAWESPPYLRHLAGGLAWALGRTAP
jgi:type 1 glutamine amidotransferase